MSTTNTPAVVSRNMVLKSPGDFHRFLLAGVDSIKQALPGHLKPDRMLRLAVTAFSTTPALRECTAHSILASIVVAAQLGLEPGIAGQGYLIPYKGTCTFVPGWQGLVGLLNNTGRATAWTACVFEGDPFEFSMGSHPRIEHKPGPNYGDATKIAWVYACGKVNGSEVPVIEVWPIARVWKHRDINNKVGKSHYSFRHPEMYARKVVLLQVLKYMPRSIEMNNALAAANAAEGGRSAEVTDGVIIDPEPGDMEAQTSSPDMTPKETATATAPTKTAGPAMRPRVSNAPPRHASSGPVGGGGAGGGLFGEGSTPGAAEGTPVHREAVTLVQAVRNLMKGSRRSETAVLEYLEAQGQPKKTTLDFIDKAVLQQLVDQWADIYQDIPEDDLPA
jgi:recombination protein RecT